MKFNICSFYDSKLGVYSRPFFVADLREIPRIATDVLTSESSTVSRHPEDFTLFHIGMFDDNEASVTDLGSPVALIRMHELKHGLDLIDS